MHGGETLASVRLAVYRPWGISAVHPNRAMSFDPRSYGPELGALLDAAAVNELGPGTPDSSKRAALQVLDPAAIVAPRQLVDREMASACLAALWLRYDFLEESHRISQDIEDASGSYWHGIMHRREPDYDNAKYWFRRVGRHPIFPALHAAARELAGAGEAGSGAEPLLTASKWDPSRFVDVCRTASVERSPMQMLCRNIQRVEWELLFDHCYRRAAGLPV